MTRDELIALAKEAGFDEESSEVIVGYYSDDITDKLERFANLVAAKEREECAVICDGYATNSSNPMNFAENCATNIRARKP